MAKSKSNVGTGLKLDISIISPDPSENEYNPCFSITSSNFTENGKIDLIESWDQQLIDLDDVIDEFIKENSNEDKNKLADSLEQFADKLRGI